MFPKAKDPLSLMAVRFLSSAVIAAPVVCLRLTPRAPLSRHAGGFSLAEAKRRLRLPAGGTPTLTEAVVKAAFRKRALALHPDTRPAETKDAATAQFRDLQQSYEVALEAARSGGGGGGPRSGHRPGASSERPMPPQPSRSSRWPFQRRGSPMTPEQTAEAQRRRAEQTMADFMQNRVRQATERYSDRAWAADQLP